MAEPGARGLPVHHEGYRFLLLRREDTETLRGFRNAQIDVLRQAAPITAEAQRLWFDRVVLPDHSAVDPPQLLISILADGDRFIGYGGLTSLNWEARRAEVSFLVDPDRAADDGVYARDMAAFLGFLAEWSFGTLGLNRLFAETYAFRRFHISILERAGYVPEGRLREHVMTPDGLGDSIVHGLLASDWKAPR
ncbi:MAG: GNAT family N-acetyltransferase [Solirubrobacteraceae bacterium]